MTKILVFDIFTYSTWRKAFELLIVQKLMHIHIHVYIIHFNTYIYVYALNHFTNHAMLYIYINIYIGIACYDKVANITQFTILVYYVL